ncbi:HAD family hydrolase [Natronomonas sp.]|uniref:HAD family hydrolase n=1 Tax=Natronomonas sp. TaxID=2184060 RepID=UPI002FC346DE
MSIEAVCFDLDDTLYDYLRYAQAGLDEVGDYLEALTGRQYHAELFDIYFEEGITDDTFDVLVERHGLSPDLVDEMVEAYHGALGPLKPYDDAESVLAELTESYRLGCITEARGGHTTLRRLGIHEYFDEALVTRAIGHSKQDPAAFEFLLSKLSASPQSAVYVGDDPHVDFHAPNDLGMATVRLRRGRYADREPSDRAALPDHEIRQLDELSNVLTRIERRDQGLSTSQ